MSENEFDEAGKTEAFPDTVIGRNNLQDKETFRWGGFQRTFDKTAKEWREEHERLFKRSTDNPYITCSCCNNPLPDSEPVYAGFFEVRNKEWECRYQLKTLCKKCAYEISDNVIEP